MKIAITPVMRRRQVVKPVGAPIVAGSSSPAITSRSATATDPPIPRG